MSSNLDAPAAALTSTEPEAFRARSIMLSLTVDDFARSLAWYRDVLGFHVQATYNNDAAAALVAGDIRIILNQDDWKKGKRIKGQGMCITLDTAQDVDALAERIEQAGGKLDTEPSDKPWGVRSFNVTDPNGFLITISRPLHG